MRLFLFLIVLTSLAACTPAGGAKSGADKKDAVAAIPADGPMVKADDPPAPEGWSAQPGVLATKYQDAANPSNVFRLYQPAVTDMPARDWFEGRRRAAPDGLSDVRIVEEIIEESGFLVGYARGELDGAPVAVISYACKAGGGVRYGELITSQDDAIAQPAMAATAGMTTSLCRDSLIETAMAEPNSSEVTERPANVAATPAKTVPANRALKSKDIAVVLYSWEQVYRVTGLEMVEEAFLLMKDGSVRRQLPVQAPDAFDISADRATNGKLWGKWKKRGKNYELTFAGEKSYIPPGQIVRRPGKKGQRLNLYYEDSWSVNYGQTGAVKFWGIQMNKDGTFRRNSQSQMGGVLGYGDTATGALTTADDKGSATSVSAKNFGGGASSSTGVADADLTGTYEIDGYTLTLKYNNGQTIRSFFYISEDGRNIWFEGDELSYINLDD